MEFILPKELGQKIMDYLITRPFCEVENLVIGLKNVKPNKQLEIVEKKDDNANSN